MKSQLKCTPARSTIRSKGPSVRQTPKRGLVSSKTNTQSAPKRQNQEKLHSHITITTQKVFFSTRYTNSRQPNSSRNRNDSNDYSGWNSRSQNRSQSDQNSQKFQKSDQNQRTKHNQNTSPRKHHQDWEDEPQDGMSRWPAQSVRSSVSGGRGEAHPSGLSVGQRAETIIADLSHEGHGVAKLPSGFPLFIPDALPNELVEIEVTELKKTWGKGTLDKIVEPSSSRIKPPCEFFGRCGGCALQHLDYEAQLEWKRSMVENVVKRIGKINPNVIVRPVIPMETPWSYRNKIQVPIGVASAGNRAGGQSDRADLGNLGSLGNQFGTKGSIVQQNEQNRLISGFYSARSHDIVEVDHCLIAPPELDSVLGDFTTFCNSIGIEAYNEARHQGVLRHVVLRKSFPKGQTEQKKRNDQYQEKDQNDQNDHDQNQHVSQEKDSELMLILVTKTPYLPQEDLVIKKIVQMYPNIKSIYHNVNSDKTNVVLGTQNRLLWGRESIQDTITISDPSGPGAQKGSSRALSNNGKGEGMGETGLGNEREGQELNQNKDQNQHQNQNQPTQHTLTFDISPHSFFQVNPSQTQKLYQKVIDYARLTPSTIAIDAYCGVGTIALSMALYARHVFGVEIVNDAILDAKANAKRNFLEKKTYFQTGKAEEVIPHWYNSIPGFKADVIVVDPPRKGCDQALIEGISRQKIARVVYVSCSPSTLARDLAQFEAGGYKTIEIQPVDMFPHTYHCEAVALLELQGRGGKKQ